MSRRNRACYPGTFDPPTLGHLDLIRRGALLFDSLVVAVGRNASKRPIFTVEERVDMIRHEVADIPNVTVEAFGGLVIDFCRKAGAGVILRGLRTVSDFESEYQMALTNRSFDDEVEAVFVMPAEEYSFISSRLIKEVVAAGGSVARFVSPDVEAALKERLPAEEEPAP